MAQNVVFTGYRPNDGLGEALKEAFDALNGNDAELYRFYGELYDLFNPGALPGQTITGGRTLIVGDDPPPNGAGRIGDIYLQKAASGPVLYGPKIVTTSWPAPVSLVGLLIGSGAPSNSYGLNSQVYFDTTNLFVYGPKAAGVWPAPKFLSPMIYGSGAPANTLGINGQYYTDTTNSVLYGPKAGGAWPAGVSFMGKPTLAPVAAWVTGTAYTNVPPASFVTFNGSSYMCLIAHTAGTFATDLSAGRWGLVTSKGDPGTGNMNSAGPVTAGNLAVFVDANNIADGGSLAPYARAVRAARLFNSLTQV